MRLRRLDDEDDEDYDEDEDDDMSGGLSDAQMRRLGNKAQWTPLSLFASSLCLFRSLLATSSGSDVFLLSNLS